MIVSFSQHAKFIQSIIKPQRVWQHHCKCKQKMHPGPARGGWLDWIIKEIHSKGSSEEEKDESILGSQIYCIKDATRDKTDRQITDKIMKELGFCNNDAYVWDRIIQSISRIALDDNQNGEE